MARRGKKPIHRPVRPRGDDLPQLLENLREATRQVWIAKGHLASHVRAQEEAAYRAWQAGGTHRELSAATGTRFVKGVVTPPLRRHTAKNG